MVRLTDEEIQRALRKKAVTDGGWVDANDLGSEALVIVAKQCMETGRYVEYSCYETTGDAGHDLRNRGAVYHTCTSRRTTCRYKLPRGDRRIVIHQDRWRGLGYTESWSVSP